MQTWELGKVFIAYAGNEGLVVELDSDFIRYRGRHGYKKDDPIEFIRDPENKEVALEIRPPKPHIAKE